MLIDRFDVPVLSDLFSGLRMTKRLIRVLRIVSRGIWRSCCFLLLGLHVRLFPFLYSFGPDTFVFFVLVVRFVGATTYLIIRLFAGE